MRELAGSELGGDLDEAARRRRTEAKEREGINASAVAGVARPSAAEAAAQTRDELWAARLRQLMGRGDDSVLRIMPAVAEPGTSDGPDAEQDNVSASQPLSARLRTQTTAIPPCGPQYAPTQMRPQRTQGVPQRFRSCRASWKASQLRTSFWRTVRCNIQASGGAFLFALMRELQWRVLGRDQDGRDGRGADQAAANGLLRFSRRHCRDALEGAALTPMRPRPNDHPRMIDRSQPSPHVAWLLGSRMVACACAPTRARLRARI